MARNSTRYVCQSCGAVYPRWAGKCDACDGWNSIVEEAATTAAPIGGKAAARGDGKRRRIEFVPLNGSAKPAPRRLTQIAEFDRVTGGGLVHGSALLIGGDRKSVV